MSAVEPSFAAHYLLSFDHQTLYSAAGPSIPNPQGMYLMSVYVYVTPRTPLAVTPRRTS